ncbi:NAD(P)-binding protein [Lojkania enalia]|uniref:NAD(P)-binding protein n=1 Tax=Lojkania enalia TaxID=147567 RepID=A0A9P4KEI2_9PLEO|nr:NAD(P)-binding protein [Didymosphaeria enalia]
MAATTPAKTIVLITGANSGIGYELASQLLAKGTYHILLGARTPSKGQTALQSLQSQHHPGTVEYLDLDVTNDDTIARAFSTVQNTHGRLDILVNNAAISAMHLPLRTAMRTSFDTNATGPLLVSHAFAPLLQRSSSPRIINVSSGAGSIARRLDPASPLYKMDGGYQYRASKAALHMLTACLFVEYGRWGCKVQCYDPGFTVSGLSENNRVENGAREVGVSVGWLVDVVEGRRDGEAESGRLLMNDGGWPW